MNKLEFENRLCGPVRLGGVLNLVIVNAAIASTYTDKKKGQPATKISIAPHVPVAGSHLVDTKSFEEGITPTSDIMKSQGKNQLFNSSDRIGKTEGLLPKSNPTTTTNSKNLIKNSLSERSIYYV